MWAPKPPDIVQTTKLIASPEKWDGNTWGDPSDNELGEDDFLPPCDGNGVVV